MTIGTRDKLAALGLSDDEAEQVIERAQSTVMNTTTDAVATFVNAVEQTSRELTNARMGLRQFALLHASGRTRKPYVKRPGEQYARFVPSYGLVQFKRSGDGLIVRV